MKHYIDYEETTGKILGFIIDESKKQGKVIEVSLEIWNECCKFNKINIDTMTFEKVDWRTVEEIEKQRISSIKAKANELIEMIYPIYKQNNILMSQITEDIKGMNAYILNIRNISNEAEANGTLLEDIAWN